MQYNIQFYNQGLYLDCAGLITTAGAPFTGSALLEIPKNGFELNKLVIGKPGGASDATNGFIDPATLVAAPTDSLDAPDTAGYQFLQARGLILIDNPDLGLVAVLPIGMAQVSSVVLSVQPGDYVEKGQEISKFQLGGSDIVMVFQKEANVKIDQVEGQHYNYGTKVATAPRK